MHLSWNEIRVRAARFAEEWKDAHYERGESQTFYNEFFEVFGVTRRRVASFEEPVRLLGDKRGFLDLFWKGVLLVEQKSSPVTVIASSTSSAFTRKLLRPWPPPRRARGAAGQEQSSRDVRDSALPPTR
ncbi:MAG: hypothetical protein QOG23_2124 [Blastocatellia bacterium]|jgi:hypothetical protein|nr:hypothetical protein [Blastocatellia bacterium]